MASFRQYVIVGVVVLILCMAGTAAAVTGVGGLITSGDDGAATAQEAQQPLGTLSVSPSPQAGEFTGGAAPGGAAGGAGAGGAGVGGAAAGGGGGSLPFAGFLAIPVLLAGAGLIAGGVAIRRRADRAASA
jgi:hypothetical protein